MNEAYNYLINSNLICENDYIIAAISGGPDSMALLDLLIKLRKEINFNIVCAHVNHNVRKESEEEKEFVLNYCKVNNIVFEYMKIEKYETGNFEMVAREKRYAFFEQLLKKYNSKLLFTAHHGDDLIETILMRIVRGSSLRGYAGFSKEINRGSYKIVRPLIFYTKSDIIAYNNENDIPFRIDSSNECDDYTRNRYRHHMLPFLKNEDSNVHKKFLKFSELLLEYTDYIDNVVLNNIFNVYKNNTLDIIEYKKLDSLIQKGVLNYIFKELYPNNLYLITDKYTLIVHNMIMSNKSSMSIELPNNILITKSYDIIKFKEELNKKNYEYELIDNLLLPNNYCFHFVSSIEEDSNYVCRLNSSDISLPLYVRNKKDGDKMEIKGMKGSKKIKDIFINSKISLSERQKWPIVVDSNGKIVWLPGLKKSKYNKEKNEKGDIIIKYEEEI